MAATSSPAVEQALQGTLSSVGGLHSIILSHEQGATLCEVHADAESSGAGAAAAGETTALAAAFGVAAERAAKLQLGAVRTCTSYFDDSVAVQASFAPLLLTLIARHPYHFGVDADGGSAGSAAASDSGPQPNVGAMQSACVALVKALEPVRTAVEQVGELGD